MKNKMNTLFDYIRTVCDSDLERIINFVMGIISANQHLFDRPNAHTARVPKSSSMVTQMGNSVFSVMNVERHIFTQLVR